MGNPQPTACTYDCPDACGLLATVEGESLRLAGDPDHPVTRGFLCSRIRRHPERLRAAERLRAPLVREGSGFREASWDEALDLAAARLGEALRESGPAAIAWIGGGGSLGISKALIGHFFASLGEVTTVRGGLCGEAGQEAQRLDFGDAASHDYLDLDRARSVVLWGKNPAATGVHLVPALAAARRRGAEVVLVEPRPTESSGQASRLVSVAPGRDGLLALAVLRTALDRGAIDPASLERVEDPGGLLGWLASDELDAAGLAARAGTPLEDVRWLASLYAESRPVATWVGWGLQRHLSGGSSVRAIDALGLLTGNVGVPGGGVSFTSTRRRGLDVSMLARPTGRTVAAATLGQDLARLDDPKVRVVYVAGANPVTQAPDSAATARALRGAGFVVVADAFMTDTAEAADLVLPVSLMLEEDDVVGSYQHHHLAVVRKVVEPPEGVRSDLWIVRELGARLGRAADPLLEDPAAALARITAPWFEGEPPAVRRNPFHPEVPFAERFPTPSGKARLLRELPRPAAEVRGYPLALLSVSSRAWQTSQLPEARQVGPAVCHVHPEAETGGGLEDGSTARLESPLGGLVVTIRHDRALRRDVAVVHRGGWVRNGRGLNLLVEARETDLGGGAAFYSQRVRLERALPARTGRG